MLETYRVHIVAGIIALLGLATYVSLALKQDEGMVAGAQTGGPVASENVFVNDGYLLTGHPELKDGVWYLVHSQEGENAKAAELSFDEESFCVGSKASGICRPDKFINMREARVEGTWEGEQLRVQTLTFTAPLQ